MTEEAQISQPEKSGRREIYIALIGVLGMCVTGFFSNLDKVFPEENVVTSVYSGYQPSSDAKTEVAYLLHITGAEAQMKQQQQQLFEIQKKQFSELLEGDPEILDKMYAIIDDELPKFNDKIFDVTLDIQSQHFTIQEIQELNKFYSTPIMKEYIRRQPAVLKTMMDEILPIALEFQSVVQERLGKEILSDL
ncbi:MAG: hypothetical protein COC19_02945 [SAR86 cluster bacterium]|uniref:DUF2059 domain-containing protein n=1 Tax=SAR86 cluster bacterium TaxID=2030880 RepID=A0A2A4MQT0_9GAMM|nr:MAG: hypothetical protein COC19_02945 [SAR86 cluster bacterium]